MPTPSRYTSGLWRYKRKPLVPITPTLRLRCTVLLIYTNLKGRYADAEPLYKRLWQYAKKPSVLNTPTLLVRWATC